MTNSIRITIWGREFILPVEYDCYSDESVTYEQTEAVKAFGANADWIDKAKGTVEKYCLDQVSKDTENKKKDNIFSYIKPEYLYVKREEDPRIALMCKYRYEIEHGLAIVFSHDGKVTVGIQDIIL